METPDPATERDITPSGFADRLTAIADQLATGELTMDQQQALKHALFEDITILRRFQVATVNLDATATGAAPPADGDPGVAIHVPRPDAISARLTDQLDRLDDITRRLEAYSMTPAAPAPGEPPAGSV